MRIHLIVKENMRFQNGKNAPLVHSAEEKGLIDRDVPCTQSCHHPLVSGSAPGGDDRCLQMTSVRRIKSDSFILKFMKLRKFCKQICERSRTVRDRRLGLLLRVELIDAGMLVDGFRTVIGDHSIKVECDSEFIIAVLIFRRTFEHLSGGITFRVCPAHSAAFAERNNETL